MSKKQNISIIKKILLLTAILFCAISFSQNSNLENGSYIAKSRGQSIYKSYIHNTKVIAYK